VTATSSRPGLDGDVGPGLGDVAELCGRIAGNVQRVIVGKPDVVRVALVALLAEGHLLVEDVPGVGKTSLAKALARSIDCSVSRVQFTPDLLPGDITGLSVFNRQTAEFEFRPGPVFANIVIADEINRASPKTQSALLECMAEHQVTVDGATYALASPFMVVATQNPVEMDGTYPLPEAQRDRFTARVSVGYPDPAAELAMVDEHSAADPLDVLRPVTDARRLRAVIDARGARRRAGRGGTGARPPPDAHPRRAGVPPLRRRHRPQPARPSPGTGAPGRLTRGSRRTFLRPHDPRALPARGRRRHLGVRRHPGRA
jgi:MoxR-like ATPase